MGRRSRLKAQELAEVMFDPPFPGEVLSEYFNGASCYEISDQTNMDVTEVYKILNGVMAIRPYHAEAFASYLGTSVELWTGLQEEFNRSQYEAPIEVTRHMPKAFEDK